MCGRKATEFMCGREAADKPGLSARHCAAFHRDQREFSRRPDRCRIIYLGEDCSMAEATCRRELDLEIPADEVTKKIESVAKEFARVARVPGFRPGKAPVSLIRRRFAEDIKGEVLQALVPERVEKAVSEQKLTPVSQPQVEKLDFAEGQPLKFRAVFEVLPEFELGITKVSPSKCPRWTSPTRMLRKLSRKCANALPRLRLSKGGPSKTATMYS